MRLVHLSTSLGNERGEASTFQAAADLELEADLRRVIEGKAVPAFRFQPIADLTRSVVAGYEALVRLPTRAMLAPDLCLAAAGRAGLQEELEAVITGHALRARHVLPANVFLSINVSPAFLCSDSWAGKALSAVDLSGIVVEITEAELIEDYQFVRKRIANIFARGGMVAIDDAGAGYASLKHILELKPNFIKLDRSLVQNCSMDRAKSTMIEVLGAAANRMDAWVITEGVETAAELTELMRLGVPLAQGYFLGRPSEQMADLSREAQRVLAEFAVNRAGSEELLLCAEPYSVSRTEQEAQSMLSPECPLVVVADQWNRPMELLEYHALCGPRVLTSVMRCHHMGNVQEALQRALTRSAATRFDPILLTDGEGHLCGVVRMERLMQAVLDGSAVFSEIS